MEQFRYVGQARRQQWMLSTSEQRISLPDTRHQDDELRAELTVQLPYEDINFPELPVTKVKDESDSESDEEPEMETQAMPQDFLGKRPAWMSGNDGELTAYAAARHRGESWALFGRGDGTLELYCLKSRLNKPSTGPISPPLSPEVLLYPQSNLLSSRLIGKKARRSVSAASSVGSYSYHRPARYKSSTSPEGSVRSSTSHSDLPSALGRKPRKASATLSISGIEAITSAPDSSDSTPHQHHQVSALLQAPAIIQPSPSSPPDPHFMLSESSTKDRKSLANTWAQDEQDSTSPKDSDTFSRDPPATPVSPPDVAWTEPLEHFATIRPPQTEHGASTSVARVIKLLFQEDGFYQGVVLTHDKLVNTTS